MQPTENLGIFDAALDLLKMVQVKTIEDAQQRKLEFVLPTQFSETKEWINYAKNFLGPGNKDYKSPKITIFHLHVIWSDHVSRVRMRQCMTANNPYRISHIANHPPIRKL